MRLNKKRLAALAMSAVMAASAVPFPVYAEELSAGEDVVVSSEVVAEPTTEAVVETPEVGADTSTTWKVDEKSIKWYYNNEKDYGVTFTKVDTADEKHTEDVKLTQDNGVKAKVKEEANCGHGTKIELSAELILGVSKTGEVVLDDQVEKHTWKEDVKVTKAPTCCEAGKGVAVRDCTICEAHEEGVEVDIPATGEHDFDESKGVQYRNFKNAQLDENGKPEVIDVTVAASYDIYGYCKTGKNWVEKEKVEIPSTTVKYAKVSTDKDTIKGIAMTAAELMAVADGTPNEKGLIPIAEFKIDIDDIKMLNCDEAGSYVVEYTDNAGHTIDSKTVAVAPHHYMQDTFFVFENKSDSEQVTIKAEKDGTYTVTSNSCVKSIKYKEVKNCANVAGCNQKSQEFKNVKVAKGGTFSEKMTIQRVVSVEDKEAKATGKHVINKDLKKAIEKLFEKKIVSIAELEKTIEENRNEKTDVTVDVPAEVCEKGGVVTVNYICTIDKKTVVESQEYTVTASGHITTGKTVIENEVAATCEANGKYDSVLYCTRCGKEIQRISKVIPRLKHTNEVKSFANGTGEDNYDADKNAEIKFVGSVVVAPEQGGYEVNDKITEKYKNYQPFAGYSTTKVNLGVYTEVFTNCEKCHNHEVRLNNYLQDNVTLKVKEVENDKNGEAGYIVFETTYTKENAGADNGVITVVSPKIPYYSSVEAYNGRVEPESKDGLYKDEDGKYRYYVDGVFQKDTTGVIDYAGNKFVVVNGVLANETSGLWYDEASKTWYFLSEGQVRADYSGTVLYDGEWFYVSNGKLNEAVNGLVAYNGGTFLFTEGRLRTDVSGLWQDINDEESWYYLALGQVQTQHSGVAMYDGGFFVVKEGKLDKTYNGTIEYDGETFKVVGGQLVIK